MTQDIDPEALDAFAKKLEDPKFRSEFNEAPRQALERAGINVAGIPEDFLSAIAELSTTELRLIADILKRARNFLSDDFLRFPF